MPPVTANTGRNNRGRPRNNLTDNVTTESRRPGRTSGQVVRNWGSRVPNAGDRIDDARLISSPEVTWNHLRLNIGAFYRESNVCGFNGCTNEMTLTFRAQKNQFYYRCRFAVPIYAHRDRQESITSNTVFYNSKKSANIVYCVLLEYFRSAKAIDIFNTLRIQGTTIAQISRDCQVMMNSDYVRYHGDYLLGANELCDHIQIDESKFGKRKNNRGSYTQGVWVFGMVEALRTNETYLAYVSEDQYEVRPKLKAGKAFVCTVPNRSAATLIPIIQAYCARGSVIRSDGRAAYSSLHPSDVIRRDGSVVPAGYTGFYFSRHQVVNHSEGFETGDQVQGNQTEGLIHTNVIEGFWAPIKRFIHPRNRTIQDCPGKLLEYMWRRENQGIGLIVGMERCIREVEFNSSSNSDDASDVFITRAQAWDEEQENISERQPYQHEDDYDSAVSSDSDSDDDGCYCHELLLEQFPVSRFRKILHNTKFSRSVSIMQI